MFVDRILLAYYSLDAMAATVMASTICTVFQLPAISIAAIVEVFVGQYNGAGKNALIGKVVWQMIWFSAATSLLYVPIALYAAPLFFSQSYVQDGVPYFKIIMLFAPLFPLIAALAAFYIGQGKVRLVTFVATLGNILNVLFAYLFIFGVPGWIPTMGTFGAGLATGFAGLIQASILFIVFLRPKFRTLYHTWNARFSWPLFLACFKVGSPSGMGYIIEMSGWAILLQIMAKLGEIYVAVVAIGEAIYLLMTFATDGLYKTVVVTASNLIGAKKSSQIPKVFQSALTLHAIIALLFIFPLLIKPELLIHYFTQTDLSVDQNDSIVYFAKITCIWVWIYFIFDGIVWIIAGLLTALKNTVFVMLMNTFAVWIFAILPVYVIVSKFHTDPASVWKIMTAYTAINAMCFYWRYRRVKKAELMV